MKNFFVFVFIFSFIEINAQIIGNIKNGATTKATDYNRTRSNKEKNDLNASPSPKTTETEESSSDVSEENAGSTNSLNQLYQFQSVLTFDMISYENSQEIDRKQINYFFTDSVFMMKAEQGYMINDYRIKKAIVIDEDSKAGISTALISPEIVAQTRASGVLAMNL